MAKSYKSKVSVHAVEMIDGFIDVKLPAKSKFNNGNFITVFQKALTHITVNLALTKGALRLFLYLMSKTEITNEVKLPVHEIAETLKISSGNAYDFLNELKRHNIVIWENKLKTLRLNYEIGYKGKVKDYKHFQHKDTPLLLAQKTEKTNQLSIMDEIRSIKEKED
jgi:hypothetical protein